jgi:hypothetical protein
MKIISRTTEYTLTVAIIVGDVAASLAGVFSGHTASVLATISVAVYAISRGLAKSKSNPI